MKSFFKKLAFVMAMAMVVSLAAPAAANAATVLQAAHQESKEVVTVLPMEVNEEVDLCFLGAPEGWRQLERGWTTSDDKIATVDNDGLIKAVAPGKATIKFNMEGCESAVVEVVVNAPVVADEFEVTQKSGSALDINFAGETSYDVKDVTLYIVYENASDPENPIEIKWPIDTASSKKNGNVITVTPFVKLGDGDNYKVVVGNYSDTITTKIGDITDIQITAAKNEVYTETPVKVTPKLLSNGVDLTDRYINNYDIEYTVQVVAGTSDDLDYSADEATQVLEVEFFEANMTVAVTATVKNAKNEVLATSNAVGITSVTKPAWSFDGAVVDWALISESATVVDWSKKSVPADKSNAGEYSIVLKFQDSEGKTYVTAPNAIRDKGSDKDNHTYINGSTDAISAAKYAVYFYSANEEVMLVDEETGEIGVYTPATGVFYIGLEYYGGEEDVLKYIYAGEVKIEEATKLNKVYPKKDTATVTKLTDGDFVKKAEIELVAEDQYGETWSGVSYAAYFLGANNAKVALDGTCFTDKAGFISLEGADFAAANDSVERVYIEATSTDPLNPVKLTTTIDVTIVAPKTNDAGEIVYDTVVKNRYTTYPVIALEKGEYDLKNTTAAGTVVAEIDLYKTSNGAQVGYYETANFATPATEDEIKALTAEGTTYVVVRDPSKKIVDLTDDLTFALNTVNGNAVTYAATGTYTVEVVTIRYNSRNGNRNDYVVTSTIEVKNTASTVTFVEKKSNTFSSDCIDGDGVVDVKDVIVETMKFKLGNDVWADMDVDDILDYQAVVLNNAVIIQWVKVKVPVAGDMYVEKTIVPSTVVSVKLATEQ